MRARRSAARPGLVLAALLALPALAAVLGGLVHVSRCLPVADGVGRLGIHLALLRPAAECPSGTLGVGGQPEQVLAVALVLTAPGVLGHLAVLGGALGAGRLLRRVVVRLASLAPWRRLPRAARVPVLARLLVRAPHPPVRRTAVRAVPLLRGPPLLATA